LPNAFAIHHHILAPLTHRGPILTVATGAASAGLVGMLNLNGSMTKRHSLQLSWSEHFTDTYFKTPPPLLTRNRPSRSKPRRDLRFCGFARGTKKLPGRRAPTQTEKAIMACSTKCMHVHAIIPTSAASDRVSRTAEPIFVVRGHATGDDAEAGPFWTGCLRRDDFSMGADDATELTQAQTPQTVQNVRRAVRLADELVVRHRYPYQQGLKTFAPATIWSKDWSYKGFVRR